jgi:hypothetical protein
MTSLIRVTDVDTNQIKPFMPSDLFLRTQFPWINLMLGANSNFDPSLMSNPLDCSVCLRLPPVR